MEKWGYKFKIDLCKSKGTGCSFCASLNYKHVILDCDAIKSAYNIPGKMSDCIIIEIRNNTYVAVVELKGASYSISEVCSQLEEGAALAKRILAQSKCARYRIFPVFVSRDFRDSGKARALKEQRIVIDGKRQEILFATCGKRFSDVVSTKRM